MTELISQSKALALVPDFLSGNLSPGSILRVFTTLFPCFYVAKIIRLSLIRV